jgi:hypothetical protein
LRRSTEVAALGGNGLVVSAGSAQQVGARGVKRMEIVEADLRCVARSSVQPA